MASDVKPPPKGTGPAGRAVWRIVLSAYDLERVELSMLMQAVVVADRVAALDKVVDVEGVTVTDDRGNVRAHPALVESRQQRLTFARLMASMRLPDLLDEVPQRRGRVRGFYRPSSDAAGL